MRGYVTIYSGERYQLPTLLQWSIKRTDGDPCDAFSLRFLYDAKMRPIFEGMVRFEAMEGTQLVFTGVVDDFEISMSKKGLLAEVTGRGLAALLLDTQVRAAEYLSAQLPDIISHYVTPCGITKLEMQSMPPVSNFVVETGYTCFQVLAGFCRHSAEIFPRFSADGTLVLKKETTSGKVITIRDCCTQAHFSKNRYGLIATQVLINTRNGQRIEARNEEFLARGGRSIRVNGITGQKVRAIWRGAQQRIDDAKRNSEILTIEVPGAFVAEPLDEVQVFLPELGISNTYTVQEAESVCDETGLRCCLVLR